MCACVCTCATMETGSFQQHFLGLKGEMEPSYMCIATLPHEAAAVNHELLPASYVNVFFSRFFVHVYLVMRLTKPTLMTTVPILGEPWDMIGEHWEIRHGLDNSLSPLPLPSTSAFSPSLPSFISSLLLSLTLFFSPSLPSSFSFLLFVSFPSSLPHPPFSPSLASLPAGTALEDAVVKDTRSPPDLPACAVGQTLGLPHSFG